MVTGGFLIVLLAVFPAVAASSYRDNAKLPICQRSAVYMVMEDLYHCTADPVPAMPSVKTSKDFTEADIARYAQDYCTVTIPNGLSCFQDKIRECNATFKAKVSQLAERGVGLLCQPGGVGVNPTFSAVLDGIDEEELQLLRTNSHRCPGTSISLRICHRRVPLIHENTMLSLDELVAWMQGTYSNYVTCSLRAHKMVKDTCPYWKAAFLYDIRSWLKMYLLGVQMPEELARELEMLTEAGSNHA